ncbi:MAG: PEGA domain-containing protein [Microgenomates group bacterium]
MKLKLWILVTLAFGLSACNWSVPKSGIEIISYPSAKVYIDDKEAGMTPYKSNTLKPGEVKVKLMINGQEWIKTVHLENGANTVINREFSEDGQNGGYLLYFEGTGDTKKSGIMLSSRPDRSTVLIDDEVKGFSPIRLEDIGEGDRKLTISYPGHKSINSYIRMVNGYQLVIDADLIEEKVQAVTTTVPTPTEVTGEKMLRILETETGWLRVRSSANSSGTEVTKIKPGEKYKVLQQSTDWTQIDLGNNKNGWILSKYAEIL